MNLGRMLKKVDFKRLNGEARKVNNVLGFFKIKT